MCDSDGRKANSFSIYFCRSALHSVVYCIAPACFVAYHVCGTSCTPWLFSHPITTSLTHTKPTVQYRQYASHKIEKRCTVGRLRGNSFAHLTEAKSAVRQLFLPFHKKGVPDLRNAMHVRSSLPPRLPPLMLISLYHTAT